MPSLLLMRVPKKDEDEKTDTQTPSTGVSPTSDIPPIPPLPRENGNSVLKYKEKMREWHHYPTSKEKFFFSNKGVFPKTCGHSRHSIGSTHTTFLSFR